MAGKLKPLDVERETRPGKYADGDGLYLIVSGPTSKNWSYRYYKDGNQRWLGLERCVCYSSGATACRVILTSRSRCRVVVLLEC